MLKAIYSNINTVSDIGYLLDLTSLLNIWCDQQKGMEWMMIHN